jgi:hypothetical protein
LLSIEVSKLGAIKSDFGHCQNEFHHNGCQHGCMPSLSLKLNNATADIVPINTLESKMTELITLLCPQKNYNEVGKMKKW